jgi:hypothetical protein
MSPVFGAVDVTQLCSLGNDCVNWAMKVRFALVAQKPCGAWMACLSLPRRGQKRSIIDQIRLPS